MQNTVHTFTSPGNIQNLIIIVRADPIICGHSTEARNLAEAAKEAGYNSVHIISYPLDILEESGLPLKPHDRIQPYSPGIEVHRPSPIGDYKVLDGRLSYAISGQIVDLLYRLQGKTAIMDLYLVPHGQMVINAVQSFQQTGVYRDFVTIGEAVGSDITNVVQNALKNNCLGAAQMVLSNYLMHDIPVAVSHYTKELILQAGKQVDEVLNTNFESRIAHQVGISYPAINTSSYLAIENQQEKVEQVLSQRNLQRDGFILFLSRVAPAKGVDDLIHAYRASKLYRFKKLVICGTGPALPEMKKLAQDDPNIQFFDDISDQEKGFLMHACFAYALPSKPRPEFTETFGIAAAEKMLAGGLGPVITTRTGGIPEATGGYCLEHLAGNIQSLTEQINRLTTMSIRERESLCQQAQEYALQFDKSRVLNNLTTNALNLEAA